MVGENNAKPVWTDTERGIARHLAVLILRDGCKKPLTMMNFKRIDPKYFGWSEQGSAATIADMCMESQDFYEIYRPALWQDLTVLSGFCKGLSERHADKKNDARMKQLRTQIVMRGRKMPVRQQDGKGSKE